MNSITGKLAVLALVLWGLTVAVGAWFFIKGTATKGADGRTVVTVSDADRALILTEMRTLLTGVQGVVRGVAEKDRDMILASARGNGMDMAQDVNPSLMGKLPMDFKKRGMGLHKRFDDLSQSATGRSEEEILKELADIMDTCVACHSSYKLVTAE